jgi:hypothetical protein
VNSVSDVAESDRGYIDTLCHHLVVMTEGADIPALPGMKNEPKASGINE